MKRLFILFLLLLAGTLCASAQGTTAVPQQAREAAQILAKPDSLLTREQLDLKYRVTAALLDGVAVVGDRITVTATKADFVAQGIPEAFHDALLQSMGEVNRLVETMGLKGQIASLWEQYRTQYRKSLDNYRKQCNP